jgi:hypothetical protein
VIDRVVGANQLECYRVVDVLALALYLEVRFGEQIARLAAPVAPFGAPGNPPLTPPQIDFGFALAAGGVDERPVPQGGKRR